MVATGQAGDTCASETACVAGLSCQIDGTATGTDGNLLAACTAQNAGRPAGAGCDQDADCRNGTCALGRCIDLCGDTRDCPIAATCMEVPRVAAANKQLAGTFGGCLPAQGSIQWTIPIAGPTETGLLLPVPSGATSISAVFSVEDRNQLVGVTRVAAPDGAIAYDLCRTGGCEDSFYTNHLRHRPALGESVLAIPSSPEWPLQAGVYRLDVSSLRPDLVAGSSRSSMRASSSISTSTSSISRIIRARARSASAR